MTDLVGIAAAAVAEVGCLIVALLGVVL